MKQPQYSPLTNAEIVCVIYAGTKGYLDKIAVGDVGRFERACWPPARQAPGPARRHHQQRPQGQGRAEDKIKPSRRVRCRFFVIRRGRTHMPSLKDLKNRIDSVKSTRKITKAMQMVAAAKLRRAQDAAEASRPYTERFNAVMAGLAASRGRQRQRAEAAGGTGSDQVHLLVVMTAERGLCGGFNTVDRQARAPASNALLGARARRSRS
jgi:hypothetical protein